MAADQISGFSLLVAPFVRARANCLTTPAALQHFVTPGNRLLQEKWLAQSFTKEGYSSFIRWFSDKRLVVSTSSLVFSLLTGAGFALFVLQTHRMPERLDR
jgi:hypothetical protein